MRHPVTGLEQRFTAAEGFFGGAGLVRLGAAGLCLAWLLLALAAAQEISYTVQVAAVSDEARALELQQSLASQGFAAYLLAVPTEQGLVYRLRLGAFANRAAAAQFAAALPTIGGGSAAPALAENIPPSLIPLEPELLSRDDPATTAVEVLPWGEGFAVRTQPREGAQPARYLLLDGSSFSAWRAARQADGSLLLVESLSLWPEGWESLSAAERDGFRQTVLGNLATSLELSREALEPFVFEAEGAAPFLILAARRDPETGERERLPGLARPEDGLSMRGPELLWLREDEAVSIAEPEPLWAAAPEPEALARVQGQGWEARADDDFTRLDLSGEARGWRAVAGAPLWASGSLLAVLDDGRIVLYALRQP